MPSDFARRMGQAIASQRKAAGLTQEQLAEKAATSAEWVSQVERGVGNPSIALLEEMAAALNTTPVAMLRLALEPFSDRADLRELWLVLERIPADELAVVRATADALAARFHR